MSYTMTMEPEVEREAATYATSRGFTMEQLMRYCIEKVVREELRKRSERKSGMAFVEFMRQCPVNLDELDIVRDRDDGVADAPARTGASFARAWGRISVVDGELDLSRRAEHLREIDFA